MIVGSQNNINMELTSYTFMLMMPSWLEIAQQLKKIFAQLQTIVSLNDVGPFFKCIG
jgi:hypothetical protein